ncbi:MAG TPA: hypothetical protein ACQGQH_09345 [Xylella sp.]
MSGNPIRSGSSGGAWIANIEKSKHARGNYVVGINSFHIPKEDNAEYSPYFDQDVFDLLKKVKEPSNIE